MECTIRRHLHIGTYSNSTSVVAAITSDNEMNAAIQGLINLFHTLLKSHVCISLPRTNILMFSSSFLKEKEHMQDLDIVGRIISKWIFKK